MLEENFHDCAIVAVIHQVSSNCLKLKLQTENGLLYLLEFEEILGWDFSPFEAQNIIFDIKKYDAQNFPDWLKEDYDITEYYQNNVKDNDYLLYTIDSSIGMCGYIVSRRMIFTSILT